MTSPSSDEVAELSQFVGVVFKDQVRFALQRDTGAVSVELNDPSLHTVGAALRTYCADHSLVLFDPQVQRIIEPSHSDIEWPPNAGRQVEALRMALAEHAELVATDTETGRKAVRKSIARRLRTGERRRADPAPPPPMPLPFDPPDDVPVPRMIPPDRRTERRLARLLADLGGARPETRRLAASWLGGWDSEPRVEQALLAVLDSESDAFTRGQAALSFGVIGTSHPGAVLNTAAALLDEAAHTPIGQGEDARLRWGAVSLALFGAVTIAIRVKDPNLVAAARQVLDRVGGTPIDDVGRRLEGVLNAASVD